MSDPHSSPTPGVHTLRKPFRKALNTALKRARRKEMNLLADVSASREAEAWRLDGEAIKAHLADVRRGQTEVTLPDPLDPETTRTIELDPCLKPMDNARRLFKKARKLRDGLEVKQQELDRCREEIDALSSLLERVDTWRDGSDPSEAPPEDLVTEAEAHRVHVEGLSGEPKSAPGKAASGADARVREFVSHDGWTLLVGKGDRDNDRLSFKVARGNDWWFHVARYAGSHVLARPPEGQGASEKIADKRKRRAQAEALPQETLLDAATLATHFSKARGATKAEVHYTQAKHLHKQKGAPAGQVILNQHRSVMVRMEEKRLRRLTGNR